MRTKLRQCLNNRHGYGLVECRRLENDGHYRQLEKGDCMQLEKDEHCRQVERNKHYRQLEKGEH